MKQGKGLTKERLLELLEKIRDLRVGMMGDVCLDVYWHIDMRRSQLSRETPHYNLPVDFEKYAPGAGGTWQKILPPSVQKSCWQWD